VPKALRRDFYALSGLFYIADNHFELFFKSSKDSREQMTELAVEGKPGLILQEINLDSLSAYLRSRFPHRGHADPKGVSSLVKDLKEGGYTTIQQIEEVLNKTADAFLTYEGDHPPQGAAAFTDVGAVRVSIGIADDKFNEIVLRQFSQQATPYDEKYKSLVRE